MFQLYFDSLPVPQLSMTKYLARDELALHACVRGRFAGAYCGYGTFQWSAGVRAVASLAVQSSLASQSSGVETIIKGEAASLAASLDYAIDKEPAWMLDMFGIDRTGRMIARRLFQRSNAGRKRPGPVAIALNRAVLPLESIEIYQDGHRITAPRELQILHGALSAC